MNDISERLNADVAELKVDEVMLRYVRKSTRAGVARPRTVLDFLGEQRSLALSLMYGAYSMRTMTGETIDQSVQAKVGMALRRAIPFLWTHEMRALASHYQVPDHVIGPAAFPHELMWWTFETALEVPGNADSQVDGMLIGRISRVEEFGLPAPVGAPDGWFWFELGTSGNDTSLAATFSGAIPDGTRAASLGENAAILGAAAFLNSHVVEVTKRRPIEDDKRWHGRRVGDPASLNVVTLRSSVREAVAVERGEGPAWKQRWLVRGHLRAQWYPSTKSHQVIWISPYLKGPENAPLKVPVYRVAR